MANMTSWHKVAIGSTEEQVRTLLGSPRRVVQNSEHGFTWSFGAFPLFGSVTFENGRVVGIILPPKSNQQQSRRRRSSKVRNHDADEIRRLLF